MLTLETVDLRDRDEARWLRWLDAECFPGDPPVVLSADAEWTLGYVDDEAEPVAYAGWKPHVLGDERQGFLHRAGVLPSARGAGFQRLLVAARVAAIASAGLRFACTYVAVDNAPSMRSLMAEGFKPYVPSEHDRLASGAFVHWRKRVR